MTKTVVYTGTVRPADHRILIAGRVREAMALLNQCSGIQRSHGVPVPLAEGIGLITQARDVLTGIIEDFRVEEPRAVEPVEESPA